MSKNNDDEEPANFNCHLEMIRTPNKPLLEQANPDRDLQMRINNNNRHTNTANLNDRNVETDRSVTIIQLLFLFLPILTHTYDLVSDVYLTTEYFESGKTLYGYLTTAFVILPAITITWISSRMYEEDSVQELEGENRAQDENTERLILARMFKLRSVYVIFFQLSLPLRYLRCFLYAWLVRKFHRAGDADNKDKYYLLMVKEQEDVALLNIVGCFLESAPQLILQLSIVLTEKAPITTTMWFKIVGGCVTLVTLGWSMMSYHRAIRLAQLNKPPITWIGRALIFIWQFSTIAARIFLIGISASKWRGYTTLACMASCVGWTAVLYMKGDGVFAFSRDKTVSAFAPRSWMERFRALLFSCILAVVYTFTFINLTEGPTFCRYLVYNLISGVQNAVLVFLWFWFSDLTMNFSEYLLITSVIFFIIGIVAMITYYIVCHTSVREVFLRYCPWFLRCDIF